MCRWVDDSQGIGLARHPSQRDALRIRSFQLHLSFDEAAVVRLPDTLTLVYHPRVNGSLLEINEAKIDPNSPALVALHRLHHIPHPAVFASADRVRVGPGVAFEILSKDRTLLKGVFRRADGWRLDCACAMEAEGALCVSAADVRVVAERVGELRETVEMVPRRRRRRGHQCGGLEQIPEEGEGEGEVDGCDCGKVLMDVGDDEDAEEMEGCDDAEMNTEMETVRWAVDLGIWAMCFGLGVLVTRASLRRTKRLFI
ncbi:hypothetical protein H6P81_001775 [Aristolochia fimbriata]|uniref:Protein PBN1 n=1 Tax=Aristolochia fimbriata TaxID=158543 RepID=A0AAV7F7X7_ARIFI|nr:hypothetical protein H6P81_001775 [Aristolochia fimbriata]